MARTNRDDGGHRRLVDSPDHDLKILQLTDTHLYADPGGTLLGLNTQDSFDSVMRYVRARRWPADMTLITGDLVQDASSEGYERMWHQLATLGIPIHWLPGNHDDPAVMQATLERVGAPDPDTVEMKGWRIVLLNSHVRDSDAGRLSGSELRGLEQALETATHRHVLVCLPHPPLPVGSHWLDEIGLLNADELFDVLDRHRQVRGVLCGHIHQEFVTERNGVPVFGTPSTCFQFLPHSEDFAVDAIAPGYRWLVLHADGAIETGVERPHDFPPVNIDVASTGY